METRSGQCVVERNHGAAGVAEDGGHPFVVKTAAGDLSAGQQFALARWSHRVALVRLSTWAECFCRGHFRSSHGQHRVRPSCCRVVVECSSLGARPIKKASPGWEAITTVSGFIFTWCACTVLE